MKIGKITDDSGAANMNRKGGLTQAAAAAKRRSINRLNVPVQHHRPAAQKQQHLTPHKVDAQTATSPQMWQ